MIRQLSTMVGLGDRSKSKRKTRSSKRESATFQDEENSMGDDKEDQPGSIRQSLGWWPLPQVKLASWDPEDEKQWMNGGADIAWRNLLCSMPNLFCCFGVWLSWSVIAVKIQQMHDLDPTVFEFSDFGSPKGAKYGRLLGSLPSVAGLSGGIMRISNAYLVQIAGGRTVVASNSVLLMVPMILCAATLSNPDVPFSLLLTLAVLSGIGGGGFSSSQSNMSFLHPKSQQGYALGMNGGLGNLGVSVSQLILPELMSWSAGGDMVSSIVEGWPNHAGWFWWPICFLSALAAFVWMSDMPSHGNQVSGPDNKSYLGGLMDSNTLWNLCYYYWIEISALIVAGITTVILLSCKPLAAFNSSGGKVALTFMLVTIAIILEHGVVWFTSPAAAKRSIRDQNRMFQDKHTYIMTILYCMSFGSFIGFSGAFPRLIQDLFGYLKVDGCTIDGVFEAVGTLQHCVASGGEWSTIEIINPNAPDVFKYSWLGACFGSLIRPIGGIMADKYGGANVTMLLIIWCSIATVCTGVLVQKIYDDRKPEDLFGWFVFMFVNLFFTVGAMNGSTFGTIGVLFDKDLAGSVLGWSAAISSFGAFLIPSLFAVGLQYEAAEMVLYGLASFYVFCGCLNYYYYVRYGAERPGV